MVMKLIYTNTEKVSNQYTSQHILRIVLITVDDILYLFEFREIRKAKILREIAKKTVICKSKNAKLPFLSIFLMPEFIFKN